MTSYIFNNVKNSKWMQMGATDWMLFRTHMSPHKAIEKIWLNVAASFGVSWQIVAKASITQPHIYIARVITILLTFNVLKVYCKMKENDISVLLGKDNMDILINYYANLEVKG